MKRWIALLVALMLLLGGVCVLAEDEIIPEPTPEATEVAPQETEVPETTEAPEETQLPNETEVPGETLRPEITHKPEETPDPYTVVPMAAVTLAPEDETPLEDGEYDVEVGYSATMFTIVSCKLKAAGGAYTATVTLSGKGYDKFYLGTAAEAVQANGSAYISYQTDGEGRYTFTFSVEKLDKPMSIAAHATESDSWRDRQLSFRSPKKNEGESKVSDGAYADIDYVLHSDMFNVSRVDLAVENGKYYAIIVMGSKSFDQFYTGPASDAAIATRGFIPYVLDAENNYTFKLPITAFNTPIVFSARSAKNGKWNDRKMTFMAPKTVEDPDADPTPTPTPAPTQAPESDSNKSTGKVNNSTGLKDGTYTPDSFSFSGGTGKVTIRCTKITVSGGKVTATIVFSSSNYSYVKANGSIYYGSHTGNSSTFEIPVALNANNRIIGMTTAMSQAHEVEYTIFIGLKAALNSDAETTGDAPEIMGLVYESTDEIGAAKLFKIYRFEDGVVEIAVEDVGNFLVYDAGVVLPAGIEESVILIERPVESAYLATADMYDRVCQIGAKDGAKLTGFSIEDAPVTFAGECAAPDYTALLLGSCDLAVVPEQFADARVWGTDGEADAYLVPDLSDEDAALLAEVRDRLETLGIPLFVDRSADEESTEAQLEWIKVYGVLFNCEEAANAAYAAALN